MKKRDRAYEINNGPSYLIIDDFIESIVEKDAEKTSGGDLLRESRKEAEAMVEKACKSEKQKNKNRCDAIVGLTELMQSDGTYGDQALRILA